MAPRQVALKPPGPHRRTAVLVPFGVVAVDRRLQAPEASKPCTVAGLVDLPWKQELDTVPGVRLPGREDARDLGAPRQVPNGIKAVGLDEAARLSRNLDGLCWYELPGLRRDRLLQHKGSLSSPLCLRRGRSRSPRRRADHQAPADASASSASSTASSASGEPLGMRGPPGDTQGEIGQRPRPVSLATPIAVSMRAIATRGQAGDPRK